MKATGFTVRNLDYVEPFVEFIDKRVILNGAQSCASGNVAERRVAKDPENVLTTDTASGSFSWNCKHCADPIPHENASTGHGKANTSRSFASAPLSNVDRGNSWRYAQEDRLVSSVRVRQYLVLTHAVQPAMKRQTKCALAGGLRASIAISVVR